MSSRFPATVSFSLDEFARHGGQSGPHKDGWGIAYYEGGDVRRVREPQAASDSALMRLVADTELRSDLVVSHIRKATCGEVCLANTQPFTRELGGRMHVFAHNGDMKGIADEPAFALGRYRPVGSTDSEIFFCALLDAMAPLWERGMVPAINDRLAVFSRFAAKARPLGPANILYADGDALFVHGHRRTQGPGGPIEPPGLHTLHRCCDTETAELRTGGLRVVAGHVQQEVQLFASVPLTEEPWRPLDEGEVIVVRQGEILSADA